MFVKQISVFLENKPGQLSAFIQLLAGNQIDLQALSIAESQDYGILRIIVDKPEEAEKLLQGKNWPCKLTSVLAVNVPDEPGSLTRILAVLADNDVSLAYSYAFYSREQGQARIILRVEDNDRAAQLLTAAGIEC